MGFFDGLGAAFGGSLIEGAFNARQADENRDFQRYMANTQYQRAAKDLEAAGLNRVLALGSPAPTPVGAVAPAPPLGQSINSAVAANAQARVAKEQEKLLAEQQENTQADTNKKNAEALYVAEQTLQSRSQTILNEALTGLHKGQTSLIPFTQKQLESLTSLQSNQARYQGAEADRAEVVRTLYTAFNPLIERLMHQFVTPLFNSALDGSKDAGVSWGDVFKRGGLDAFKKKFNIP